MAETQTLHDAFLDELKDAYDAEKQLVKALPKMAKAATSTELRQAFIEHLEETNGHVTKLEQVFETLGEKAKGKHCAGIAGIIEEGADAMGEYEGATMDAVLIAAGQRAEHYEMAAYGTMVEWAKGMGHSDAADLLQEILDEEGAADKKLTAIAESGVNEEACAGAKGEDDTEEEQQPRPRRAAAASISRRTPKRRR